jgi:hypothetical protein
MKSQMKISKKLRLVTKSTSILKFKEDKVKESCYKASKVSHQQAEIIQRSSYQGKKIKTNSKEQEKTTNIIKSTSLEDKISKSTSTNIQYMKKATNFTHLIAFKSQLRSVKSFQLATWSSLSYIKGLNYLEGLLI